MRWEDVMSYLRDRVRTAGMERGTSGNSVRELVGRQANGEQREAKEVLEKQREAKEELRKEQRVTVSKAALAEGGEPRQGHLPVRALPGSIGLPGRRRRGCWGRASVSTNAPFLRWQCFRLYFRGTFLLCGKE